MHDTGFTITGFGAVTPVGLTAGQTCASVRAGISRFTEHPYHYSLIEDNSVSEPQPLIYSPVPFLDPLTATPDRILNLALASCEEVFASADIQRSDLKKCGLFLAVSPEVKGIPEWGIEKHLPTEFYRRAAISPFPITKTYRQGRAGFFHAMADAMAALADNQCKFALIGGVDSYLGEETVKFFDFSYRLKSDRNVDGFIPGEAAAFIIAESMESAKQRGAKAYGVVEAISFGMEDQNCTGDRYSTGCGLAEVLKQACSRSEVKPEWAIGDLNGESYRANEWGVTISRLSSEWNVNALWHPADCVGDIRAAGPGLHTIMACSAFAKKYAPAEHCVVFGSDELGERAGCLVKSPRNH